ncbi:MAG: glycosyltransferase [bacterium]
MQIAVIIPSYQSWPLIERTLMGLQRQTFDGSFEVVVVDSSGDSTASQIRAAFPEVAVIETAGRLFPGAARNRGIAATGSEIIAFIDGDAEPSPDWLATLWRLHQEHPEWAGVGGSIANGNASNFIARIAHLLEFSGYTPGWPARIARVIPTCNLSLKRSALPSETPFLESTWGNEDVELVARLAAAGQVIRFEPSLRVTHFSKTDFGALCRQQGKLGESTAIVRRRYNLPGSWLARTPGAWLLTPAIKAAILWRRAFGHESGAALLLVLGAPWIAIALWAWMAGFRRGLHTPSTTGPA